MIDRRREPTNRTPDETHLSADQRSLLDRWLPHREVVADHSWGQVGTYVLEVEAGGEHLIVKAADDRDHHLAREIHAHHHWLRPWTSLGRAPVLMHADAAHRILVTRFLPGRLVQGDPAEQAPDTYRQAGGLLARLHAQTSRIDADHARSVRDATLASLEKPHRIEPATVDAVRALVAGWPEEPVALVPTHGDWQPRNWLVDEGVVRVIDFGRAALRPASTDLIRLVERQFRGRPDLEQAFLDGYGRDPRRPGSFRAERLAAAIGTAVWAYAVGDEAFELEGRRTVDELLGAI